jgi:hypothetical protein
MLQMDTTMANQKKEEDFMMRLLKIAQPMMQQQPEFMQPPRILEEYDGYFVMLTMPSNTLGVQTFTPTGWQVQMQQGFCFFWKELGTIDQSPEAFRTE